MKKIANALIILLIVLITTVRIMPAVPVNASSAVYSGTEIATEEATEDDFLDEPEDEGFMTRLISKITGFFKGWNPNIVIFIISLLPILEMRGGMIAATLMNVPYLRALIICMVGNILPIPFILLFIKKIFAWLKKFKYSGKFVNWLETKTLKKRGKIDKYGFWGLILFVGIPLPGTGGWTGALLASLLGIPVKKSSIAIGIGICLCAVIMSVITYLIPWLVKILAA